jgi:hypothetical protein
MMLFVWWWVFSPESDDILNPKTSSKESNKIEISGFTSNMDFYFLFKKLISELNNNIEKSILEETYSKNIIIMYVFNVILKHILKQENKNFSLCNKMHS